MTTDTGWRHKVRWTPAEVRSIYESALRELAAERAAGGSLPAPDGDGPLVYLLHFDRPYQHARHYMGSTDDLDARLREHEAGRGARLLEVVRQAGIGWTLTRTWDGGRDRERQLKARGHGRHCPECMSPPHAAGPAGRAGEIHDGNRRLSLREVRR